MFERIVLDDAVVDKDAAASVFCCQKQAIMETTVVTIAYVHLPSLLVELAAAAWTVSKHLERAVSELVIMAPWWLQRLCRVQIGDDRLAL